MLREPARPAAIVESFARFRALCAVRDGARGVEAINAHLAQRLRSMLGERDHDPRSPWFIGRPVIVRRNDPVQRLFNGDIGIALPAANGELMVHFPQPGDGLREVAPLRLPQHETAFAMTVHKAQGSEFDAVFVLLPAQASRVLTRELLYTAVTRARRQVTLAAGAAVLAAAIEARTRGCWRGSRRRRRAHKAPTRVVAGAIWAIGARAGRQASRLSRTGRAIGIRRRSAAQVLRFLLRCRAAQRDEPGTRAVQLAQGCLHGARDVFVGAEGPDSAARPALIAKVHDPGRRSPEELGHVQTRLRTRPPRGTRSSGGPSPAIGSGFTPSPAPPCLRPPPLRSARRGCDRCA
ncbi:MAG TPA: ATP-binding domain-containing protein [Burkholderiaceae bacterium]|nr:ATP-binding domain-containing protein [Burkholderiaceae bacterium]